MLPAPGITNGVARIAKHPWYFETDSAEDALAGRHLLERYLGDHCEEGDFFPATLVFGELMSNVIKHAPKSGGVRVWLEPAGKRYALCINDAGRGFDERALREAPDDRSESGRGLYIVRQVCEDVSFGRRDGDGFVVRAVLPVTRR